MSTNKHATDFQPQQKQQSPTNFKPVHVTPSRQQNHQPENPKQFNSTNFHPQQTSAPQNSQQPYNAAQFSPQTLNSPQPNDQQNPPQQSSPINIQISSNSKPQPDQSSQQTEQRPQLTKKKSLTTKTTNGVKTRYVFKNIWKFWLVLVSSQQNSRQYQIEEIFTFKTLDYFFHYFQSLPKLSELRNVNNKNISLALFKEQIKPAWEDPENQDGGYFSFSVSIYEKREVIDDIWFNMLLKIIGNSLQAEFKDSVLINGIYMKLRPNNNSYDMQIWVKNKPTTEFETDFIKNVTDFCHECSGYDFYSPSNSGKLPKPSFLSFQSKKK